jgi:hypothetical protein
VDKDVSKPSSRQQAIDLLEEFFEIKNSSGLRLTTAAILPPIFYTYFVDNIVRKANNRSERP